MFGKKKASPKKTTAKKSLAPKKKVAKKASGNDAASIAKKLKAKSSDEGCVFC